MINLLLCDFYLVENKKDLQNRSKKWLKPKKRRSDVIFELAKSELAKQEIETRVKTHEKLCPVATSKMVSFTIKLIYY